MEKATFSFVPHHNAVTKAGDASLSKFTHALAEFIDNSIEATFKATKDGDIDLTGERRVEVNVLSHSLKQGVDIPPSYITIADNGCGMTFDDIRLFACFALDKQTRNEQIKAENTSCIGKFGVGAKQSGFWLGERIHVVTKTKASNAAESPSEKENWVRECILDSSVMDARSKQPEGQGPSAFESEVISRPLFTVQNGVSVSNCNHEHVPLDERENFKLMELLENHERSYPDHFTFIIIKMKPDKASEFFRRCSFAPNLRFEQFPAELAQIYHFHLHPEHRPGRIHELPKFNAQLAENKLKKRDRAMFPLPNSRFNLKSPALPPLNITFNISEFKRGTGSGSGKWEGLPGFTDLIIKDVRDAVTQHVEKAGACFRFIISIPKPESERSKVSNRQLDDHGRVRDADKTELHGMLFYFPFENGAESRPLPSNEGKWTAPKLKKSTPSNGSGSGFGAGAGAGAGGGAAKAISKSQALTLSSSAKTGGHRKSSPTDGTDYDANDENGSDGAKSQLDDEGAVRLTGKSVMETEEDNELLDEVDAGSELEPRERMEILCRPEQSIFDIYWSDRLLPNSHANKIEKLFPHQASTPADCEKLQLPVEWSKRLKGYLFFDNQWQSVTNNKLALRLDLDSHMSQKDIATEISITAGSREDFKKFLQECHKHLDREFLCSDRMRAFESKVGGGGRDIALFRNVVWGGEGGIQLSAGDFVKINLTPTGAVKAKPSAGNGKDISSSSVILGKIVAFSVSDRCQKFQESYHGAPEVHYLRLPIEVYHGDDSKYYTENLRAADESDRFVPKPLAFEANKPCSIQAIFHPRLNFAEESKKGGANIKATPKDVAQVALQALDGISLTLFKDLGDESGIEVVKDSIGLEADKRDYYKFGIQLLNKNKTQVISLPPPHIKTNSNSHLYQVRICLNGGASETYKDLWYWDPRQAQDVRLSLSSKASNLQDLKKSYFSTYGPKRGGLYDKIKLNVGKNTYVVEVLESSEERNQARVILSKEYTFTVVTSTVGSWRLILDDSHMQRHMHSFLPRFKIELRDEHDNVALDANCTITVKIVGTWGGRGKGKAVGAKQLSVSCYFPADEVQTGLVSYISNTCDLRMDDSDKGVLSFGYVPEGHEDYRVRSVHESSSREFEMRGSELGGLWLPCFPTDGSFSNDENFARSGGRVKFTVSVDKKDNIDDNSPESEPMRLGSHSFEVDYRSTWKLAEIRLVDSENEVELKLYQGQVLPELKFQCFDRFGLKVAPGLDGTSRKWIFCLDCDQIDGPRMTSEANINGEFFFRDLRVKDEWLGPMPLRASGVCINLVVRLVADQNERLQAPWDSAPMSSDFNADNYYCRWEPTESYLNFLQRRECEGDRNPDQDPVDRARELCRDYTAFSDSCQPPQLAVPLVILPDSKPSSIKVFHGDVEVRDKLQSTYGTPIEDLTLRVFDKNGKQLHWDSTWFLSKKKNVTISWNLKMQNLSPADDMSELNLAIPPIPAALTKTGKLDASVTLKMSGEDLRVSFTVAPRGGRATEWNLVVSEDFAEDGIQAGNVEDFAAKVLRVAMVDQNGYEVQHEGNTNEPTPLVFIYEVDPEDYGDDDKGQGARKTDSDDEHNVDDDDDDDDDDGPAAKRRGKPENSSKKSIKHIHDSSKKNGASSQVGKINGKDFAASGEFDDSDNERENENSLSVKKRSRAALASQPTRQREIQAFERCSCNPILSLELQRCSGDNTGAEVRETGFFYFQNNAKLDFPEERSGDKEDEKRFLWVVVKDEKHSLVGYVRKFQITHGVPHAIEVRCKQLRINEWAQGQAVGFVNEHLLPNLEVRLIDRVGQPAVTMLRKIKNLDVSVKLEGKSVDGKKSADALKRNKLQPSKFELKSFSVKHTMELLEQKGNVVAATAGKRSASLVASPPALAMAAKKGRSRARAHNETSPALIGEAAVIMEVDEAVDTTAAAVHNDSEDCVSLVVTCSFRYLDGLVSLEPVEILCKRLLLNNVIALRVETNSGERPRAGVLTIGREVGLGKLMIYPETADKMPLTAEALDSFVSKGMKKELTFSDKVQGSGSKRKMLEFSDHFLEPEVDVDRRCVVLTAISERYGHDVSDTRRDALWKVGHYTLDIVYEEMRNVDPESELKFDDVKLDFAFRISPGPVGELWPDTKSYGRLSNCAATSVGSPAERIIASQIRIGGRDAWGTETSIPEGRTISCSLRFAAVSGAQINASNTPLTQVILPALVGADADGQLRVRVRPGDAWAQFNLELVVDVGNQDGCVEMVFRMEPPKDPRSILPSLMAADVQELEHIAEYVSSFAYTTNKNRIRDVKNLQSKLQDLESRLVEYENKKEEAEHKENEAIVSVDKFLESAQTDFLQKHKGLIHEDNYVPELQKELKKMTSQIADQEKSNYRRERVSAEEQKALSRQIQLAKNNNVGYLGHVVELAYVDDEDEAHMLSWVAQTYMHNLVTTGDRAASYDLAQSTDEKISLWPLADIKRFKYKSGTELVERNDAARAEKRLPAREIKPASGSGDHISIPGNPRAMVNIIKLSEENEHLRDSVFHNVFQDTILFNDEKTMLDWKKQYKNRYPDHGVPTLWALKEGYKVQSDGRLDKRSGILPPKDKLKFLFGAEPPTKSAYIKKLKHDKNLCVNILEGLKASAEAKEELSELLKQEDEYRSWKSEIDEIKEKLSELQH